MCSPEDTQDNPRAHVNESRAFTGGGDVTDAFPPRSWQELEFSTAREDGFSNNQEKNPNCLSTRTWTQLSCEVLEKPATEMASDVPVQTASANKPASSPKLQGRSPQSLSLSHRKSEVDSHIPLITRLCNLLRGLLEQRPELAVGHFAAAEVLLNHFVCWAGSQSLLQRLLHALAGRCDPVQTSVFLLSGAWFQQSPHSIQTIHGGEACCNESWVPIRGEALHQGLQHLNKGIQECPLGL